MVSEAASGRHMGQGKIPAAQNHMAGFQHPLRAGSGVLRVVLIVPVHGDNALSLRAIFQEVGKGGFQGRPLAPVHRVVEQMDLGGGVRRVAWTHR